MYYLITLAEPDGKVSAEIDHESFIDSLVERQLVLLGGPLDGDRWPEATAAYVLRCASRQQADDVVATDPLVASGVATATVRHWDLAAIDPRIIDSALVVMNDSAADP